MTSNQAMASAAHNSEQAWQAQDVHLVVDTIPTLAWSAHSDGSADFFNQCWLDYTGLSAEQALNWGWKIAIHPDDLARMLKSFQEAVDSGKPFEVEGRLRRSDGEFRWFLFRGNPLLDESVLHRVASLSINCARSTTNKRAAWWKAALTFSLSKLFLTR